MKQREQLESMLTQRGWAGTLPSNRTQDGAQAGDWRQFLVTGLPPGQIVELTPRRPADAQRQEPLRSSGLISFACRMASLAAAAAQQAGAEQLPVAWLDPFRQWDPASAATAGVELDKVLWVRFPQAIDGRASLAESMKFNATHRETLQVRLAAGKALPQAMAKAASGHRRLLARTQTTDPLIAIFECAHLVLQAGLFRLTILDLSGFAPAALSGVPRSAWFRLLRAVERNRSGSCLVLAPCHVMGNCAAWVLEIERQAVHWGGPEGAALLGTVQSLGAVESHGLAEPQSRSAIGGVSAFCWESNLRQAS